MQTDGDILTCDLNLWP